MKQQEAESSSGPPLLSTDTAAHAELRMRVPYNCPHHLIHFGSTMRAVGAFPLMTAYLTYTIIESLEGQ